MQLCIVLHTIVEAMLRSDSARHSRHGCMFLAFWLKPKHKFHQRWIEAVPLFVQTEFCMTSEAGGGIGGRLQSYAGLDGDIYLRGGGGPEATGVLNTGQPVGLGLSGKGDESVLCCAASLVQ
jgi:hypothetical protein